MPDSGMPRDACHNTGNLAAKEAKKVTRQRRKHPSRLPRHALSLPKRDVCIRSTIKQETTLDGRFRTWGYRVHRSTTIKGNQTWSFLCSFDHLIEPLTSTLSGKDSIPRQDDRELYENHNGAWRETSEHAQQHCKAWERNFLRQPWASHCLRRTRERKVPFSLVFSISTCGIVL